ncbi:hypothetical protein V6D40_04425 [Corynebacterium sp. Q4381]|uniref:hypothetical protein n=1 Tax=Corynebacterium sp. Marseille-Q4381 TaxID=3121597 RepID=UPI002FE5BBC0
MADQQRRVRRRVRRVSDADYDRTADAPVTAEAGADADRAVQIDEDADEQLAGIEFYEAERPPHHGGN